MVSLPLVHRVRQPATGRGPWPALVMVHGWLGDEKSMWAFQPALPPGALVVSVRAPYDVGGGYGWTRQRSSAEGFEAGFEALIAFVAQLPAHFPADPARLTLMGFSQGAALGYALLLQHPEGVHGLAALAGFLPPAAQQATPGRRLDGKPVFIAHGLEDPTVPVAEARAARDFMLERGASITYHESRSGHKLSAAAMRELKAWLTVQTSA